MANYSNLKTAIENAVDWNNGDNEITGQNLLDILETIIDSLGAKYKFADVATPSSSITTPDEPLFYLAGAGTYTNFSGLTVNVQRGTLAIFYYDTAWHWTSVRTDSDAFFNVNQYLEAPSTTYTKANARNAVPAALRSKGMIITYLTTNGWLIEQNLSTSGTWNADANWQTIGPVSVSQNTVSIGGVDKGELAGQIIDNPEWVRVVTDSNDKVLYGVKTDGKFYFGDGCPPQVQEYVTNYIKEYGLEELIKSHFDYYNVSKHHSYKEYFNVYTVNDGWEKITYNSSLGEYDDLDIYQIGEQCNFGGDTANSYQATSQHRGVAPATITQDFIIRPVYTLNEALEAIPNDIKSNFFAGQVICFTNANNEVEVWELQADDSWSQKTPMLIQNPEFIQVTTDSEGKILQSRNAEGINKEYVGFETPKASIDGHKVENIEDSEGRIEILTDSEGKIISYRKADGTKVENVGIETDDLNLTEKGMTDFQQVLRDSGFQPKNSGDFSDKDSMYIPEPRLAHLNIISDFDFTTLTKVSNVPVTLEFYDGAGNYFKKYGILNGQGRSSLAFMKKGLGLDFFNENPIDSNFDEDNTFSMKFGNWVSQDSFHIKSYYTDWSRCTNPIVYKLANEVFLTRGVLEDRPYKKYYVDDYSDSASANSESDLSHNMETGARCVPDGFPVIVYQNGEFWGVNSWQLKKHRDNYMLSKKKATNIHLDGYMGTTESPTPFWLWDGTINWTAYCSNLYGIETRNPKNLYCIDGKKYDVDTHNVEIIDTATAEAWIESGVITPTGKTIDTELAGYLRTTGKVRKAIEDLTTYVPYIQSLIDGGSSTLDIKDAIEERFDVNSFIDYILIQNVIGNWDAWDNNGQIITWGKLNGEDVLHWSVNVYDCDLAFGNVTDGTSATAANNDKLGSNYPLYEFFWNYYNTELKNRYKELRDNNIFSASHIINMFRDWMDRVGYDNYSKEYKKWNESPCFRDGSQTYSSNPTTGGYYGSIERIYLWIKKRIEYMDAADFFDYNQN